MVTRDKSKKENQEYDTRQNTEGDNRAKRMQISFVEEGVQILYAGVFNIGVGEDEVVLTFGNQSIDPNVVRIDSKVAVTLRTAKRMAVAISDIIRRYETRNGVIEISS